MAYIPHKLQHTHEGAPCWRRAAVAAATACVRQAARGAADPPKMPGTLSCAPLLLCSALLFAVLCCMLCSRHPRRTPRTLPRCRQRRCRPRRGAPCAPGCKSTCRTCGQAGKGDRGVGWVLRVRRGGDGVVRWGLRKQQNNRSEGTRLRHRWSPRIVAGRLLPATSSLSATVRAATSPASAAQAGRRWAAWHAKPPLLLSPLLELGV